MARSTLFVVGEMLRQASMIEVQITIKLSLAEVKNRARSEPRYFLMMRTEFFENLGFIAIDDERGYQLPMRFSDVGAWLAKYLSDGPCAVTIEIEDASLVGVGFKGSRLDKQSAKFAALDVLAIENAANSKTQSVSSWYESARKKAVTDAAENMRESVALIKWMKDPENEPEPEWMGSDSE